MGEDTLCLWLPKGNHEVNHISWGVPVKAKMWGSDEHGVTIRETTKSWLSPLNGKSYPCSY